VPDTFAMITTVAVMLPLYVAVTVEVALAVAPPLT
jgi:hypothetical protein